jgi:GntR family transcriptional repressor for pyruvate dehydrogenase complex
MARLHREAMRWVLDRVLAREFRDGQMLPREVDLAAQLGMSRGVVREAIRGLEERGVVSVKHGRGATVRPLETWDVLDDVVLRALLASTRARSLVAELIECRRLLEVDAAWLAASRATAADIDELQAASDAVVGAARGRAGARGAAELTFSRVLVRASGNRPLAALVSPVLDAMAQLAPTLGRRRDSADELARILTAVRRGDADGAAEAMGAYLDGLARHLRRARIELFGP